MCGLDTGELQGSLGHRCGLDRGVTRESWAQVWFRHRGVLPLSVNVKYIKIVTLIQIVIKIDPCPRIHSLFLI